MESVENKKKMYKTSSSILRYLLLLLFQSESFSYTNVFNFLYQLVKLKYSLLIIYIYLFDPFWLFYNLELPNVFKKYLGCIFRIFVYESRTCRYLFRTRLHQITPATGKQDIYSDTHLLPSCFQYKCERTNYAYHICSSNFKLI